MSVAADDRGRDPSATSGGLQTNPSKPPRAHAPTSKDVPSTSAIAPTQSNIGKIKRKAPPNRSAKTSREASPTRSVTGSKPPLAQAQSAKSSASEADLLQPGPPPNASQHPSNTTSRLTIPPTESRLPAPTSRKKSEPPVLPSATPSSVLRREGSDQPEQPNDPHPPSGMRTPRNNSSTALETVVESSLPATPAIGFSRSLEDSVTALVQRQPITPNAVPEEVDNDSGSTITRKGRRDSVSSSIAPMSTAESESESGYKSEEKTPTSSLHKVPPSTRVFGRRPAVAGEGASSRSMTVETETVSSVPQVGLGTINPPGGASIRSKKSTDTIRAPRREKKRLVKKSVTAGPSNPSSKADIFAAKIAEAVDDVNSSDSEETFVYESNPPDPVHHPHQRPTSRFHSRTPSATSIGPDPRGQRLPLLSAIDGTNSTGKKGMKFVNNSLNKETNFGGDGVPSEGINGERGTGSSRENHVRGDRNGGRHHNGHRSILADDGPFHRSPHKQTPHSLRSTASPIMSPRQSSQPPSPKVHALRNGALGGGRRSSRTRVYEADIENGDNERTPLVSTSRARPRRRALNSSLRQMEHNARRRSWVRTYAGCIVAIFAIILILTGVGGFLVATTNALQSVRVLNVTDVLVSKQEIMLDLVVEAVNPNAIAVTVGSMDVNLFAKSSHVREGGEGGDGDDDGGDNGDDDAHDSDWWELTPRARAHAPKEHPLGRVSVQLPTRRYSPSTPRTQYHINDNVDEGTDPPDEPPGKDKETMLLGRIFSFDSVLTFEGSPIRRVPSVSTGELRLAKPGNRTEEGGTARWERVLLHPFELIVRGVLKYQLPLSGRIRTAPISGSVMIHPELNNAMQ